MHGRGGCEEDWIPSRHMWPVPALATATATAASVAAAAADVASPKSPLSLDYFSKDGRKISVGDCALFKPPQETSPPFIGIIRRLTSGKEDYLKLGVNWLYRPADIKLGKGVLPEVAPNEVFYSFHKDEIPAASLLHPCKVAFLRKGVELPPGISSFVCRRVYDTTNKRLWWLTDQDYINERQEEVDQLLDKTRLEMNAVQSGGRSPKPLNGPSTPQLKAGSDGVQSSSTSFPSQTKGKKRGDRGDQGSEPVKRERSLKTEDFSSTHFRGESMLKSEIAKITEKGGLVDYDGVEKLVELMQTDRVEKKIDLAGRIMLVDVIASTDRYDCLGKFLQLKGVSVLDEWLQEVHKGKIGDGASTKENDKSVEDFLFALLRALDKLPVNLDALQSCHLGKSVNHLRTHKNLEIQKKARGLIDTWKKRVEAEWNTNDVKSGSSQAVSWPSKSGFPDVSHGGGRRSAGSAEAPTKNSIAQISGSKTAATKISHGDSASKLTSTVAGSSKISVSLPLTVTTSRDSPGKVVIGSATSDIPSATVKEEKSSSSSQSPNSHSCSSDHGKTMSSSWKEDGRGSTAGSNVSKTSGASRHRKSNNGILGSAVSGVQKETSVVKCSSLDRKTTSEKISHTGSACDAPLLDHGNNQRLIVRLPNLGRSPARSASGSSFDDPSATVSRASSPGVAEKHDQLERKLKVKSEAFRANISADFNAESWQWNSVKDGSVGSDEGNGSPGAFPDEDNDRTGYDNDRPFESSKVTSSGPGSHKPTFVSDSKHGKPHEASLRSINVLIDSCIKGSEANTSLPVGDDRGMNLLASVAAEEMSKSDLVSPSGSPRRSSPVLAHSPSEDGTKLRFSGENDAGQSQAPSRDYADGDREKKRANGGALHVSGHGSAKVCGDSKLTSCEEKIVVEQNSQMCTSSASLPKSSNQGLSSDGQPGETTTDSEKVPPRDLKEECTDVEENNKLHEKIGASPFGGESMHDSKSNSRSPLLDENKDSSPKEKKNGETCKSAASCIVQNSMGDLSDIDNVISHGEEERETKELSSLPQSERGGESSNVIPEASVAGVSVSAEVKHPSILSCNAYNEESKDSLLLSGSDVLESNNVDGHKSEVADAELNESQRTERGAIVSSTAENCTAAAVGSDTLGQNGGVMENSDRTEVLERCPSGSAPHEDSSAIPVQETTQDPKSWATKISTVEAVADESASAAEASPLSGVAGSDAAAKLDIDLNEGFPTDEATQADTVNSAGPACSVRLPGPLPFPLSSMSSSLPSSITVAAAAKGPFVLPENLLRNKGEIGWKGSAATSAFRPAEPRKVLEMPIAATDASDTPPGKQGRPPLDIDLNVADERVLEDMASHISGRETISESMPVSVRDLGRNEMISSSIPSRSAGGLDLDLNRVDEATDLGQFSASTSRRTEAPLLSMRASSSGGVSNGEVNVLRNFDLNNGPGLDEVSLEPAPPRPLSKSNVPFLSPVAGVRMNNDVSSLSSWFTPGSYPGFAVSSILPDRGDHPYPVVATAGAQRILGPSGGGPSFGPDMYRGPVLSSAPALAFSPATAQFPYPGFPFGSSFPLPSTSFSSGSTLYMDSSASGGMCFPAVPSQLMGAASAVPSHFPRPYVISVPDGTANGGAESSRKWGRQGLDLNAGPGGADNEGRDDRLSSTSRQISVSSAQAITEEQVRMYQAAGAVLKRKEPEGGWDTERFNYKQPSWQ
ncbi:hypothetical protein Scep_021483 [Stephania cephalantha]|uniref:Uncharacterized protein n=1 Tax=Stephania cephalantha TaxID=152367 RepID=A0AAP0I1X1_9MAGN